MRLFPDYPEKVTRLPLTPAAATRLQEVKDALDEMGALAETAWTALPIDFDQMLQIREQVVLGVSEPMPTML